MGVLSIRDTRLYMDDQPFHYQGLSFFNALYNHAFNQVDDRGAVPTPIGRVRALPRRSLS